MPYALLVDRQDVAARLDELAGDPVLQVREQELRTLAADLRRNTDLQRWAHVDLHQAFALPEDPPELVGPIGLTPFKTLGLIQTRMREARQATPPNSAGKALLGVLRTSSAREDLVEALLGVLVFCPLLVTWYALTQAANAYDRLSKSDPSAASKPFLQLWQTGFDGHLASWATFGNMATTAVCLVVTLLLTAVWHALSRQRASAQESLRRSEWDALRQRLASVLTRTRLLLPDRNGATPAQFGDALAGLADGLAALSHQATAAQASLAETASATASAAASVQTAATVLAAEIEPLRKATDRIGQAVEDGTKAQQHAADGYRQVVKESADSQRQAVDSYSQVVRGSTAALAAANAQIVTAVDGMGSRIAEVGDRVHAAVRRLADVQSELVASAATSTEATERVTVALVEGGRGTTEALGDMRLAAERWDAAAAHWEDASARLRQSVEQLAEKTEREGSGLPAVSASNGHASAAHAGFEARP